jgi:hypothetical protein
VGFTVGLSIKHAIKRSKNKASQPLMFILEADFYFGTFFAFL